MTNIAPEMENKTNRAVEHPLHYNQYPVETIVMMERVFGREKTIDFCLLSAFKYRMRLGHKDNIQQDLEKEQWYLDYAAKLMAEEAEAQTPNTAENCAEALRNAFLEHLKQR